MREAGDHKRVWYHKMKDRGLGLKLALDDHGALGGMIQYVPIEHAPAEGRDLYMVLCVWVHGSRQGRGNFQHQGMGTALLHAAEDDVRTRGAKGIAAWGIALPFWMKASWFKKRGFRVADRTGIQVLLWKPFTADAQPPRWARQRKKPERVPGKVTVTAFCNGWCPAQNLTLERAKRAAAEIGDQVMFRQIDTSERPVFEEWGIADAVFVDGKQLRVGPPPSYERVRRKIARRARRL